MRTILRNFFVGNLKRIFSSMAIFSIATFVFLGIYVSGLISRLLYEQVEKSSLLQMQRAMGDMDAVTLEIESMADDVARLAGKLVPKDNYSFGTELEKAFSTVIDMQSIGACVLSFTDGREYIYNPSRIPIDLVRLKMFCGYDDFRKTGLSWFDGEDENQGQQYMDYYIVRTYRPYMDGEKIGIYFFVHEDVINRIIDYMESKNNLIVLHDENGKLIATSDKKRYVELVSSNMSVLIELYENELDFFSFKEYAKKYVIAHYQSSRDGIKFFGIYENVEFYGEVYGIMIIIALVVIAFCLVISWLYSVINKQYITPVKCLTDQMQSINGDNIDAHMDIHGNEEINLIVNHYNKMLSRINQMVDDIKVQEKKKIQVEMDALRHQINYHFLYNTLSNIKILAITKGQKEISSSISKLAYMYKYLLSYKSELVKLSEEIEFIRNYISLMNERYKNGLSTFYLIDEEDLNCNVPAFLLQPIVENAIIHGLNKKLNSQKESFLRISTSKELDKLLIKIEDNGRGIDEKKCREIITQTQTEEKILGVGLYSTISRLRHQYGDCFSLDVESVVDEYTRFTVSIPYETL